MNWVTTYVVAFACCISQQGWSAAQASVPAKAVAPAEPTVATRSGVADGAWSPALTGERRPLYRLQKSDVVEIDFAYSPEFNQSISVQPDGFIALRGAASLYAEGETIPDLEKEIAGAYTGILRDPDVTIVLKDFDKPFFIAGGEVNRPGKYELHSDLTVSEAIAQAGGFTPRAKHAQVVLFRRLSNDLVESHLLDVKAMLRSRNLNEDMQLKPGDMLYVPQNLISKIRQYMPGSGLSLYLNPAQF